MAADVNIYGCRTPNVFEWDDANLDYVEISLYIHAGSAAADVSPSLPSIIQYQLKLPEITGKCYFDVSPFVKDLIDRRHFTDDRFYYCDIYVRKTISGSTGAWDREFQLLYGQGYNYSFQRQNDGTVQSVQAGDSSSASNTSKYFLTDQPYLILPEFALSQVPVRWDDYGTGSTQEMRMTEFTDSDLADPNAGPTTSDTPSAIQSRRTTTNYDTSRIYGFPATTQTGTSWLAFAEYSAPNYLSILDSIQIQRRCVRGFTGTIPLRDRYTKIIFVNKYGAREVLFFFGARKIMSTAERDAVDRTKRIGVTHDRYAPMKATRIKNTKEVYDINTGWYPREFYEVFRQLLFSEQIWIFTNFTSISDVAATQPWRPFRIIDSDFTLDAGDKEKNYNWRFTFESADDLIAGTI